jgi:hypothetical protein
MASGIRTPSYRCLRPTLLAEILRRDPAQRAPVVGEVAGGEGLDPGTVLSVERRHNIEATGPSSGFGRVEEQTQVEGVDGAKTGLVEVSG